MAGGDEVNGFNTKTRSSRRRHEEGVATSMVRLLAPAVSAGVEGGVRQRSQAPRETTLVLVTAVSLHPHRAMARCKQPNHQVATGLFVSSSRLRVFVLNRRCLGRLGPTLRLRRSRAIRYRPAHDRKSYVGRESRTAASGPAASQLSRGAARSDPPRHQRWRLRQRRQALRRAQGRGYRGPQLRARLSRDQPRPRRADRMRRGLRRRQLDARVQLPAPGLASLLQGP